MVAEQSQWYRSEARQEWARARRKARLHQFRFTPTFPGQQAGLLDFNEIEERLNLRHPLYRGVQNVPLAQIVGSVGRYRDFTGAFLPAEEGLGSRWQHIATIYLDPTSGGVPPVELYKVGAAYFVKDGNHRVSVARQLGMTDIEAYVWEYPGPVPDLSPDADLDTLIIAAERQDFLEKTRLDELRPGHGIELTAPGGYPALLAQIEAFQQALSQIDGRDVPWPEAVTGWYDLIYETSIQAIERAGVMSLFPGRTRADFFVWVRQHQRQLEERYGRRVKLTDAARDFRKRNRPSPFGQLLRAFFRWLLSYFV